MINLWWTPCQIVVLSHYSTTSYTAKNLQVLLPFFIPKEISWCKLTSQTKILAFGEHLLGFFFSWNSLSIQVWNDKIPNRCVLFYLKYFLTSSSMCELITYKLMYSASQNVKHNVKIARILGYLLLWKPLCFPLPSTKYGKKLSLYKNNF